MGGRGAGAVSLEQAVARLLGVAVTGSQAVSGGDINQAHALRLADGRTVFAKSNPRAPAGMFAAEARGLEFLRAAGALRIPAVVAVAPDGGPDFLLLEHIESAPRQRDFAERLGRGLAALHRFGAPGFGLDHDNFIGRLPQNNRPLPEPDAIWGAFYAQRRLLPQLRLASDRGLASARMTAGIESLCGRIDDLVGPPEPPARLHGDLWGGNLLVDDRGQPCLIDPAVHGGHREVDLAMMRLFGGFPAAVFAAYDESFPLAAGHQQRVALYQLYPLLVHVNLFGGGYVSQVEGALRELV